MPWSSQNGGGGPWGGGGNKGPWGQGPQPPRGGGGGGGKPPDLDEIIRRGQDMLRRATPGGGSGGGALIGLIVVVFLLVIWLSQAIYTVQPDQRGVELRFGAPKQEIAMPGLHFLWWPFETVDRVPIVEQQMAIGSAGGGTSSGLMLTGDQNIVEVQFNVLYAVTDPKKYLFNIATPDSTLRQVSESAMREVVGRRPAQDIFRDNRAAIAQEVKSIIQSTMNDYNAGLNINAVSIEDAAPPQQVADAFDEVQRAEQDEDRFKQEANQYANKKLGQARGEAAQLREAADAYRQKVVNQAQGESQRFTAVLGAYQKAPEVTRRRLYLDTMQQVLGGSNKVILDKNAEGGGQGVVPYLPLPEVRAGQDRNQSGSSNTNQSTQGQGGNQ
ncbi:FtsH protease activity modulator HflK [Pararhizobium mangrovi]|uniref:Protein HflK n=1 Tax=Pararhizobium mangrovi TaxID=2590452 RepID=A0A506UHW8_9HYPH|nr:FtsH protease activity modulator HflK [Pararhizobium mangrovi]TPW32906.1 FtsH protease activity modulator HflK [Pararhizobium mangrovi]